RSSDTGPRRRENGTRKKEDGVVWLKDARKTIRTNPHTFFITSWSLSPKTHPPRTGRFTKKSHPAAAPPLFIRIANATVQPQGDRQVLHQVGAAQKKKCEAGIHGGVVARVEGGPPLAVWTLLRQESLRPPAVPVLAVDRVHVKEHGYSFDGPQKVKILGRQRSEFAGVHRVADMASESGEGFSN